MSYANGTTHYNLPQTVGTDKRDWFDTNQAFSDIDAAIYGAVQSASESASAITALTTRVGDTESDITDLKSSRTTDEGKISALETLTAQHTTQIADVKADALDMICAIDEGTAQVASVAVSEGNYFRYNDVLYMATSDIAVGDTIVPNTNCRATNVATELKLLEGVRAYSADVSNINTDYVDAFTAQIERIASTLVIVSGIITLKANVTIPVGTVLGTIEGTGIVQINECPFVGGRKTNVDNLFIERNSSSNNNSNIANCEQIAVTTSRQIRFSYVGVFN